MSLWIQILCFLEFLSILAPCEQISALASRFLTFDHPIKQKSRNHQPYARSFHRHHATSTRRVIVIGGLVRDFKNGK